MKNVLILFFIYSLCFVLDSVAQEQQTRRIVGNVVNSFTNEQLLQSKIELLLPDSTVIDSTRAQGRLNGNPHAFFAFNVDKEGQYIIRCAHDGYETNYTNIRVKFYKREWRIDLGSFYLKKKTKNPANELNEVIVSATKIKFYMKGDTIVYNADAFQLSEGSMLDVLISQLPGVELKDDGQIYVNGRFVNSLLLNGKDFFKGDNKVMLDNLPSYMVKDIKVYDKDTDLNRFAEREIDEKSLVLDVSLKREYSVGWIANAEGGMGSKDRYLGRFFGLRFTPHSRLSAFGNMNNLNETRTPGRTGEWSPSAMADGLQATKMGGLDYYTEAKDKHYIVEGNAKITHADSDNQTNTTSVNFLSGGDTYGRSRNTSTGCNTNFSTDHSLKLENERIFFSISPHLDYRKYENNSYTLSGTFLENPLAYIQEGLLDSISAPNSGTLMRRIALNRRKQNYLGQGHNLNTSLGIYSYIRVKHTNDIIRISGSASYANSKNETFRHSYLDFPSDPSSSTDYRNQYSDNPGRSYNYNIRGEYLLSFSRNTTITPYYQYRQSFSANERSLYRLDWLGGWGENTTEHALGALPSTTDSLQLAFEESNSYFSRRYGFMHEAGVGFSGIIKKESKKKVSIRFNIPFQIEKNRLSYQRAVIDTTFSRRNTFFNPNVHLEWHIKPSSNLVFDYRSNSSAPNMIYLLTIRDDENPLYITEGNPNLKNTHTHRFSFYYENAWKGEKLFYANAAYSVTKNALVMGYVYDKSTGVRISTPDNVNGNWNGSLDANFSCPLDKAKRLTFSTNSRAAFYKSVDLISVTGNTASNRSKVNSLYLTENLKLDYKINSRFKAGMKARVVWTHATSSRDDFSTINAGDYNFGLTAQIELPWNMQISSDLTEYLRRGYEDEGMNTEELVWNARLSKRILKGNLVFILDGFDLLGNLSNVRRTINAQGRTESYYNVIPRYVMAHVIYRLNIKPKKKN